MKLTSRKSLRSKTPLLLLIGLLLLLNAEVHAEGGCPPGMIPYSGTNLNSCGPIPPGYYSNEKQNPTQAPPVQWATRWGAIATDGPGGSFGTATNMSDRSSAENAALADCQSKKGAACKIEISYANGCGVMIIGDKMHNSTSGATVDEATQLGMATCSADGDTNCHVYYSACSLPQRIQ